MGDLGGSVRGFGIWPGRRDRRSKERLPKFVGIALLAPLAVEGNIHCLSLRVFGGRENRRRPTAGSALESRCGPTLGAKCALSKSWCHGGRLRGWSLLGLALGLSKGGSVVSRSWDVSRTLLSELVDELPHLGRDPCPRPARVLGIVVVASIEGHPLHRKLPHPSQS